MLRSRIRPVNHAEIQPAPAWASEEWNPQRTFCHIRVVRLTTIVSSSLARLVTLVGKGSGDKRGPTALPYSPSSVEVGVVGVISIEF